MLKEINVAIEFFARIFRLQPQTQQYDAFAAALRTSLQERCEGRWHPTLHSAHRAVTIFGGVADQALLAALRVAGLADDLDKLSECVPKELVVWVDPGEVAFRIGDRGQPSTLYKENSHGSDSDSDSGISEGSDFMSCRSPSPTSNSLGYSPPPSRAVRITAPGSAPTIQAPVSNGTKPAALSPLGQAVMNASRSHAQMYNPIAAAASVNAFSQQQQQQQHFIQQQQQLFHHQQLMQQQQQQQQQQQFYHAQQSQFRRHHHQHQHAMMMNSVQQQRPRANSPTKSMVRYVEAR